MSYDYLPAIKPFAVQAFDAFTPTPTKWKLDAFPVARSLLRLLDNPDAIAQSCFGLCGQAAFLRAWAYRDPVAVANFATELYAKGSAKIGNYPVHASNAQLDCTWMRLPLAPDPNEYSAGRWGVGNRITEAVWMICGALAATEDSSLEHQTLGWNIPPIPVSEFDGMPASSLSTLTLPGEIKRWLQKTGCYSGGVDDNTKVVGGRSLAEDSTLTSPFDSSVDVFLVLHTNLFVNATFTPPLDPVQGQDAPLSWFPNHWVMLKEPITRNGGTLTMKIWTWGGHHTVQVPQQDFDDNYFGSIVAHASGPRRTPSSWPMTNAVMNPRVYYSPDNQLHFEWTRGNSNAEWFELNRVDAWVMTPTGAEVRRECLKRVWGADASSAFHVVVPMPDPTAAHSTRYEIAACRGDLRPNGCDPASYNFYDVVPCNRLDSYQYTPSIVPRCETRTTHLRLRYFGYPGPRQIPDGLDPFTTSSPPRGDFSVQFRGETIGHCRGDGSTDVVVNGSTIGVGTDARTPLSVQKVAVWFEYFCHLLRNAPNVLECLKSGKLIEVALGDGFSAAAPGRQSLAIAMDPPISDDDLPAMCLNRLLALEAAWGFVPEWVYPAYVSRVAVVQTPGTSVAPAGFADFGGAYKPCELMTVYQAQWSEGAARTLHVDVRKALNPLRPAFVFVEFSQAALDPAGVKLTLSGTTPDGKQTSSAVALTALPDGRCYCGSFQAANAWSADYTLDLAIQANRSWPANVLGGLLGVSLDFLPQTRAALNWTLPGRIVFTGYDIGIDRNHRIEVGPQSRYARVATLSPDSLEPNGSFQAATPVTSLVLPNSPHESGVAHTVEKTYDRLSFHDQQDADYFDVTFQCPAYDDTDAANRPASSGSSNAFGISYGHQPPQLACRVTPDDYRCIDIAAYRCNTTPPTLLSSEAKSAGVVIAGPSRALGAKRCCFVLTNHDYAASGAFLYSVRFAYTSAYDSITVDTNAPAYSQGRLSLKRRILDKLYDRIDQPRPPEYSNEVIQVRDVASFVEQFSRFLLEPETAAWLGESMQRTGGIVVADGLHALGELAQSFGRQAQAGGLFRKSADMRRALRDEVGALDELDHVAGSYKAAGDDAGLKIVLKEIRDLKRKVPVK